MNDTFSKYFLKPAFKIKAVSRSWNVQELEIFLGRIIYAKKTIWVLLAYLNSKKHFRVILLFYWGKKLKNVFSVTQPTDNRNGGPQSPKFLGTKAVIFYTFCFVLANLNKIYQNKQFSAECFPYIAWPG